MGKKKEEQQPVEQKYRILPLDSIEANEGQIEGLPANPRKIDEEKFELLKKNIKEYPELLEYRGLLVYPFGDKYITIGGNMRYRALTELGYTEAPCAVLSEDTTVEQLKAYIILDNDNFGYWDWDMLANDWDVSQLADFGLDNAMLQQWDELPYIEEEQEDPTLDKDIKLQVIIPFAEKDLKKDVESKVKEALKEYPSITLKW